MKCFCRFNMTDDSDRPQLNESDTTPLHSNSNSANDGNGSNMWNTSIAEHSVVNAVLQPYSNNYVSASGNDGRSSTTSSRLPAQCTSSTSRQTCVTAIQPSTAAAAAGRRVCRKYHRAQIRRLQQREYDKLRRIVPALSAQHLHDSGCGLGCNNGGATSRRVSKVIRTWHSLSLVSRLSHDSWQILSSLCTLGYTNCWNMWTYSDTLLYLPDLFFPLLPFHVNAIMSKQKTLPFFFLYNFTILCAEPQIT